MKILALDLGDVHVGTAITDMDRIIAKPLKTISAKKLNEFLEQIIKEQDIKTIVLGYPKTMQGKISAQTQKVIDAKMQLEKEFKNLEFILWDERLTSKSVDKFKKGKTKEDKDKLHSVAAALILQSYLEHLRFNEIREE